MVFVSIWYCGLAAIVQILFLPRTCSSGIVFQKKLRIRFFLPWLLWPFTSCGGRGIFGPGSGGGGGGGGGIARGSRGAGEAPVRGHGAGGADAAGWEDRGAVVVSSLINPTATGIAPFSLSLTKERQFITCIFQPPRRGECYFLGWVWNIEHSVRQSLGSRPLKPYTAAPAAKEGTAPSPQPATKNNRDTQNTDTGHCPLRWKDTKTKIQQLSSFQSRREI